MIRPLVKSFLSQISGLVARASVNGINHTLAYSPILIGRWFVRTVLNLRHNPNQNRQIALLNYQELDKYFCLTATMAGIKPYIKTNFGSSGIFGYVRSRTIIKLVKGILSRARENDPANKNPLAVEKLISDAAHGFGCSLSIAVCTKLVRDYFINKDYNLLKSDHTSMLVGGMLGEAGYFYANKSCKSLYSTLNHQYQRFINNRLPIETNTPDIAQQQNQLRQGLR